MNNIKITPCRNIKIAPYRNNGAKIFTGRDNGVKARKELELDSCDEQNEVTKVIIPTDTWGINPSFFGGMFEGSIKKFGKDFIKKYIFEYPNNAEINESMQKEISENIDYVIRNIKVNK